METKKPSLLSNIGHGKNILDVNVPKELETRVLTGVPYFDEIFGDGLDHGLTPSTTALVTGTSGAGKTTMLMQVADACNNPANNAIAFYNGQEESVYQMRKVTKRLKMKNGFYVGEDRLIPNVLKHADSLRAANPGKFLILIIDSIQCHDDGFYVDGAINSQTSKRVVQQIIDYCKETFTIGLLVGQVGKNGVFLGSNTLKHALDAHLHLYVDQKPSSASYGQRILKMEKNRFGLANVASLLGMDGTQGLFGLGSYDPSVEG